MKFEWEISKFILENCWCGEFNSLGAIFETLILYFIELFKLGDVSGEKDSEP
jgi:hypothetical protein